MSIVPFINRPAPFPLPFAPGPDGRAPVQQSEWAQGSGWYHGRLFASPLAYLAAASGAFSRGSDGTRFDAARVLQTDGPNVLRLTHDPVTGAALGALLERSATNRLTNSDDYRSNWAAFGAGIAVTPDAAMAPDGTMTAQLVELLRPDSRVSQLAIGAAATMHTATVFLRALPGESGTWPVRFIGEGSSSTIDAKRVAINDQAWTRVSLNAISGTGGVIRLFVGDLRDGGTLTRAYVWRAQIETSPFASSPIKTTTAAAQRLADSLSYAIAGTPEGTIVIAARTPLGVDGNQTLWCWDDGMTANRYRLMRDSNRNLRFVVTVGGSDVVNLDLGTVADDTAFKVAVSWKSGLFAASLNGAAAVTDSSYAGALPSVTTMREGSASDGSEWFGTIRRTARYSTAYSAAQLPGMSS